MIIRGARVIDPENNINEELLDIRTENGLIAETGRDLAKKEGEKEIEAGGCIAAPGFTDVHAHFRDPGQTAKETLHTGAEAAAAGGYTSVVCMANTIPAVDDTETLKEILSRAKKEKIHIYQAAAVTVGRAGRELVPMEELLLSGAAGFTDDGTPVMDRELVIRAMQEAARLGAVLSFHEEDPAYVYQAGINSGTVAEAMGLKGADRRAEYTMIERDLRLALETGAKVDIQHVSAKESVEIIRRFRQQDSRGLIHAEATPHHFSLTEDIVMEKGSLAKVNPPLRTEADRQAVIEGLADGTLDLIATDHAPHTAEEKMREFVNAPSGMVGLETALALAVTNLVEPGFLSLYQLIRKMSVNPAKLYGLRAGNIGAGSPADIVIFDPDEKWTAGAEDLHSRSANSPFIGVGLKGRVRYTVSEGNIVYRA